MAKIPILMEKRKYWLFVTNEKNWKTIKKNKKQNNENKHVK